VVLGWYAREAMSADERLDKAWKTFKQSKSFWR
jgi:hypothetical protein